MKKQTLVPADGQILEQILDATHPIWHEGLTRRAYRNFYAAQRATPWGREHLDRVALVDGDIVLASAKRYRFEATLDGERLRVIGLGAIFTAPAHRRTGVARALIGGILDTAAADGVDLALLFSEIGADYYARVGFTAIATHDVTLQIAESARHGAPIAMVRAGEERDLADIA